MSNQKQEWLQRLENVLAKSTLNEKTKCTVRAATNTFIEDTKWDYESNDMARLTYLGLITELEQSSRPNTISENIKGVIFSALTFLWSYDLYRTGFISNMFHFLMEPFKTLEDRVNITMLESIPNFNVTQYIEQLKKFEEERNKPLEFIGDLVEIAVVGLVFYYLLKSVGYYFFQEKKDTSAHKVIEVCKDILEEYSPDKKPSKTSWKLPTNWTPDMFKFKQHDMDGKTPDSQVETRQRFHTNLQTSFV